MKCSEPDCPAVATWIYPTGDPKLTYIPRDMSIVLHAMCDEHVPGGPTAPLPGWVKDEPKR